MMNFFTTAQMGNMSSGWGDKNEVATRVNRILNQCGIDPQNRFHMRPAHSDDVVCISGDEKPQEIICDGLLTKSPHVALTLCPADCLPIFLTTKNQEFIGLVHAGWRGINKEIARKAVERIVSEYKIPAHAIYVGIGPSLHKCCYDDNILAKKFSGDSRWLPFILKGPLGLRIDLLGHAVKQLIDCKVYPAHITVATACTCCAKNKETGECLFFSHHRAKKNTTEKEGRFLALAAF